MKKRKINKKAFSSQGITYRIFVILVNALFFKLGAKQAMQNFGALGASLIWNAINMALYFLYHGVFLKLFSLEIKTKGCCIFLTGLSGSGKSTIADKLQPILLEKGIRVQQLDGDVMRTRLSKDLGFSVEDRRTNLERAGEVAKLLVENNVITICSFISPMISIRDYLKKLIPNFIEVFVYCPLATCEARDVKGLYAKARRGEIKQFTGIDSPYENPPKPDIICNTKIESLDESANKILNYLKEHKYI